MVSSPPTRAAIEARLPHRDPFLFVDRVISETAGSIQTEWDVPADLDLFRGHFPARPVLPGVIICESAFQSAALLVYRPDSGAVSGTPVLVKIEESRFKRIVAPGETLTANVELDEQLKNACYFSAKLRTKEGLVARLKFVLALVDEEGA